MSASFASLVGEALEVAARLSPDELPRAIGEAERLKATLYARLLLSAFPTTTSGDRLLTPGEASVRLSISLESVYRKAKSFPFTRRVGRTLRFSAAGIDRWIQSRAR